MQNKIEISINELGERYIAACTRCGEIGLKRHMKALHIRVDNSGTMRLLCHVCEKCMPEVLGYLGAGKP